MSVIVGMTVSLDGFVNDQQGRVSRLYPDMAAMQESIQDSIRETGAVVMGRHTFEMGSPDAYDEHYEYQVPIFVVTRQPPDRRPKGNDRLSFTFVTDGVASAVAQARAAAGEKDVTVVGGARLIQTCLKAGLADELHLDIMPVLLAGGLRLFDHLDGVIELERLDLREYGERTRLKYRLKKGDG